MLRWSSVNIRFQAKRQSSIVNPPALPALPFDPSTSLRAGKLTNREAEGSLSKGQSSISNRSSPIVNLP
ncbi:MAG: hypothetical protein MUD01_27680 [Chloroflexaceae bacterium]|nr:hypothetical protein [Chloroflexaceae bacterium]